MALAAMALTLCTVSASAQSRSILQYYTNTLAATPTNFFGSNVLAGTNVHLERGPQGQLTVNSTGGGGGAVVDTNIYQLGHIILTNLSGTGALTNAGAFQPGNVILSNAVGTGILTNAGAFQPGNLFLTNISGTGALTNAGAFQPGSLVLTNLSGTGAFTNLLAADGGLVLHTDGVTVTVSNAVAGGGGETNYNADAGGTNSTKFGLVYGKLDNTNLLRTISAGTGTQIDNQSTNLSIKTSLSYLPLGGGQEIGMASSGTVTFRTLAADGGLTLHSNANLLTFSNSFLSQPASEILTNLSGTGALTNLALSNLVVLAANGNDATAQPGRMDLPYGSLTNALAALQDNGTLLVMPGRYPAAGRFPQAATVADRAENPVALTNRHNVSIIGLGRPILWQTNQGDFLTLMNCRNISISGIRFEGTRTNLTVGVTNPAPRADALLAFYGTNNGISISDCSFSNHMHFGIHDFGTTDSTANHVTIDNSEFDLIGVTNVLVSGAQSGHAISFGGNHWKVSNSRFRTCFRGIQAASTTIIIRDVQIRGNTFVTNINNDIELAGDGITDAQIVGNHLEGSAAGNTKRSIDVRRGDRVLVQGNTLLNMVTCEAGIRITGVANDVSVVENFLTGTYYGIILQRASVVTKVRVAGNHIRLVSATAIWCLSLDGTVIEGNVINNSTFSGIHLLNGGGGTNYIVRNNLIYDVGAAVTDNAILIAAGVDTATLEDNVIYNTVLGITDSGTATRINEKILSRDGTRNVKILSGTGSPEGVVTANIGSVYARTDGGYGTTHYAKTNGTGNTGWAALLADGVGAGGASFPTQLPTYAGASLVTDGTDVYWGGPFFHAQMWEDWHTGTNLTGRLGMYEWNVVQGGNGTFDHRPSAFGRPHVLILRTDGTSSDITHVSQFNKSHWFGRGPTVFGGSIYLSHVPSDFAQAFEVRHGFIDSHLGDATNGLYLRASTNSPAWQLYSVTNSITVTNTSISNIVAGWTAYQIHVNADATEAVLHIGTSVTNLYPVTTNAAGSIPRLEHQATIPGAHIIKKAGTDRKTNAWDYWFFDEKLTAPR